MHPRRRTLLVAVAALLAGLGLLAREDYRDYLRQRASLVERGLRASDALSPEDAYHNAAAWQYARQLRATGADAVYLADSVMGGHARDEAADTLAGLLAGGTGLSVTGVSGAGYTAVVFRGYAALTASAPVRPRLAVLAVNPRSFCDGWFFSRQYLYARLTAYLPVLALEDTPSGWLGWLPHRVRGTGLEAYARGRVVPEDVQAGEAASFDDRRRDLSAFGPAPPGLGEEELGMRRHFLENYMSVAVDQSHPMLLELRRTARLFREAGVPVLAYATPVNVQGGARLVGPLFEDLLRRDMAQVARGLAEEGAAFLDLTGLLDDARFVDKHYSCEHLDLEGRRLLAARLAGPALELASRPGR